MNEEKNKTEIIKNQTAEDGVNAEKKPLEEKMLPQSKVNELMGIAREEGRRSAMKTILEKFGVDNDEELENILGRGQSYDILETDYNALDAKTKDALAENALLKTGIDDARWEDVKLILNGKGLDITSENITELLPTHPEWIKREEKKELTPDLAEEMQNGREVFAKGKTFKEPGILKKLGNDPSPKSTSEEDEDAIARKLFGLN